MMNNELGFVRKTLSVLENYNIQVEHIPTGIDTMSIILESNQTDKETLHKAVETEPRSLRRHTNQKSFHDSYSGPWHIER